jgi:hypothetical protein
MLSGLAQSGLVKIGLANQPPSLLSWKTWVRFEQPETAAASATAQTSVILEKARWRGKKGVPGAIYLLVP